MPSRDHGGPLRPRRRRKRGPVSDIEGLKGLGYDSVGRLDIDTSAGAAGDLDSGMTCADRVPATTGRIAETTELPDPKATRSCPQVRTRPVTAQYGTAPA